MLNSLSAHWGFDYAGAKDSLAGSIETGASSQMLDVSSSHSGFEVVPLPRFSQGGRWRTEAMRAYRRPVLIWFTKGQGRITISGVKRGYGPHNAVFLPAGTMHGFDMLGQVFGTLMFFPDKAALGLPTEALHLRIRDARRQAELNGLIDQIQIETESARPGSDRALQLHAGLLGLWLERQEDLHEPDVTERNAANRLAAAFTSLAERDFRSPRSVSDYAARLGVTPTHLTRVCQQTVGKSASQLLADRIHFEARRLLRETKRPIKDIADELGFASAAYFTRAFSKSAGMPPSSFRSQTRSLLREAR